MSTPTSVSVGVGGSEMSRFRNVIGMTLAMLKATSQNALLLSRSIEFDAQFGRVFDRVELTTALGRSIENYLVTHARK